MAKTPARVLSLKQAAFVAALIADPNANGTRAALASGYSRKHAADAACRLMQNPLIRAEVERARSQIVERGQFDASVAMQRFDEDRNFARLIGHPTAAVRATEMMARVCGLIRDRAEITVEHVDIGGVIHEARRRATFSPLPALNAEYREIPNPFDD